MKKLIGTIAVAILGLSIATAGEYPDISIKELNEAIKEKKVTVIDVNGSESYKKGHIPGAIDFSSKKSELEKALPAEKDALIVAYCGGPACSAYKSAADQAKKLGYTNVKHLSAGISGWKGAEQKLESGAKKEKGEKKEKGKKDKEKKEAAIAK